MVSAVRYRGWSNRDSIPPLNSLTALGQRFGEVAEISSGAALFEGVALICTVENPIVTGSVGSIINVHSECGFL